MSNTERDQSWQSSEGKPVDKRNYSAPTLVRFGAVSQLTTTGSDFEKEENTGQDCSNNATRRGKQECTMI